MKQLDKARCLMGTTSRIGRVWRDRKIGYNLIAHNFISPGSHPLFLPPPSIVGMQMWGRGLAEHLYCFLAFISCK